MHLTMFFLINFKNQLKNKIPYINLYNVHHERTSQFIHKFIMDSFRLKKISSFILCKNNEIIEVSYYHIAIAFFFMNSYSYSLKTTNECKRN